MAEAHDKKKDKEEEDKPKEAKPEQPQPAGPTKSVHELEIEQLRRESADFKDKYFRGLAESENARKRLQKEKQEYVQYALQNLIADFLNPIDHFENALKFTDQASPEVKHWAIGFQMILNQFKDVLTTNGVQTFNSVGTHFDPHLHEAVEVVTTNEYAPGTIIEESLRGYKMGDRTIRPARVKVAKSPAPEKPKSNGAEAENEKNLSEKKEN